MKRRKEENWKTKKSEEIENNQDNQDNQDNQELRRSHRNRKVPDRYKYEDYSFLTYSQAVSGPETS
jgi:hypothetical protein